MFEELTNSEKMYFNIGYIMGYHERSTGEGDDSADFDLLQNFFKTTPRQFTIEEIKTICQLTDLSFEDEDDSEGDEDTVGMPNSWSGEVESVTMSKEEFDDLCNKCGCDCHCDCKDEDCEDEDCEDCEDCEDDFIDYFLSAIPSIKKVIFSGNATIVFWEDGTKTVVRCQKGDKYSADEGLAMAICKRAYGNDNTFNDVINKAMASALVATNDKTKKNKKAKSATSTSDFNISGRRS